jgi:endogenous inhibitor of DNA gyrase (YacG/DUF329 family)
MTPVVKCPQCRMAGTWFESKWGPFCSERCKLLDLGKWFSEENKLSSPLTADHLEDYENLPSGPELDQPEKD